MKPFTTIAIGIFSLIALHTSFGWDMVSISRSAGGLSLWVSVPGAIVTGGLAFMLWKEMH